MVGRAVGRAGDRKTLRCNYIVMTVRWYDPMSKYNSVHIEACCQVRKKRQVLDEDNNLYQSQANDILDWASRDMLMNESRDDKLLTLNDQRIRLGLKPELSSDVIG